MNGKLALTYSRRSDLDPPERLPSSFSLYRICQLGPRSRGLNHCLKSSERLLHWWLFKPQQSRRVNRTKKDFFYCKCLVTHTPLEETALFFSPTPSTHGKVFIQCQFPSPPPLLHALLPRSSPELSKPTSKSSPTDVARLL